MLSPGLKAALQEAITALTVSCRAGIGCRWDAGAQPPSRGGQAKRMQALRLLAQTRTETSLRQSNPKRGAVSGALCPPSSTAATPSMFLQLSASTAARYATRMA